MQIFIPQGSDDTIQKLLEGREILGRWRDTDAAQVVLHLLVPAAETEPIMDRFEQQFGTTKGFHVILFPVEAVLPRPDPEPEQDEDAHPAEPEEIKYGKQRISREELYAVVTDGLDTSRVFLGLTILSAVVAAVGLLRNDVAVIIGAMVIAPLLGPNVAMSLATTLGDFILLRRALVANIIGLATAFSCALGIGYFFRIDFSIPAILSRTQTGPTDIILALAAGSAGTLAFTQGLSGAVIGVMVAVALMPPLMVSGMLFGEGNMALALGALLLTMSNLICINLAGVATFLVQGVRPRNWWEAERAKKATWRAILVWVALLAILGVILWLNTKN
ncbi:TIGR00341 family protein [Gimesia sp.]|uniref:TIGR00341 family protein n=1 Tax=Gimesia sp. TaxID=2024833 RepID=UPI003A9582AF